MHRSYLYAPGHNPKLLDRVFDVGADAVVLDLEDAVPAVAKETARAMVAATLEERPAWVRVNAVGTQYCAADLEAVASHALGIRLPKVESAEAAQWVADRLPGTPVIAAVESARGVLAAAEIASVDAVQALSIGLVDLNRDLHSGEGVLPTVYARSHLAVVSRAAGLDPPIDSVYPHIDDLQTLREHAEFSRSLGFFGKSVIHPSQLPVVHAVFTYSEEELEWAREVVGAFERSGGEALRLPNGEFVGAPIADRARRLLERALSLPGVLNSESRARCLTTLHPPT
jgi:citrate lyase subunit beta/citryl-CoA lyase